MCILFLFALIQKVKINNDFFTLLCNKKCLSFNVIGEFECARETGVISKSSTDVELMERILCCTFVKELADKFVVTL